MRFWMERAQSLLSLSHAETAILVICAVSSPNFTIVETSSHYSNLLKKCVTTPPWRIGLREGVCLPDGQIRAATTSYPYGLRGYLLQDVRGSVNICVHDSITLPADIQTSVLSVVSAYISQTEHVWCTFPFLGDRSDSSLLLYFTVADSFPVSVSLTGFWGTPHIFRAFKRIFLLLHLYQLTLHIKTLCPFGLNFPTYLAEG